MRLRYNETGNAYTGEELQVGAVEYTFGTMEAASDLFEVAVDGARLSVADFVTIEGNLAIRSQTSTLNLDPDTSVEVELLTIGAGNVNAFAGYKANTPD
ncbi:hypothetical protein RZS08_43955, partial [Arthrospira platensis SPKY1]|nr:hypothetical protein [Arthrospira platensis SPKY1]